MRSGANGKIDLERFQREGYALVKGLFAREEIERLRDVTHDVLEDCERRGAILTESGAGGDVRIAGTDLFSLEPLRGVLLDPRVVDVARAALGGDPVYFADSSVRVGSTGGGWGWHRDNADHDDFGGPDWADPFPIVRCGLYLQDHARHSGGLAIRPGSNRVRPRRRPPTLVATEVGDLVIWDLRTLHSGEVIRHRPLLGVPVPARAMGVADRLGLRVPEERQRIAMFMTFGLPGAHFDHNLAYQKTQEWRRPLWANYRADRAALDAAAAVGVRVISPPSATDGAPVTVIVGD